MAYYKMWNVIDYAERVVNGNQKPAITDTEQIILEEQDPLKDIKLQNEPLQPPVITNVFVIETENSDEETDDNNLDDNETNDTQNNEIPVDSDLEENLKILNEMAKYNEIELDSMNNSPSVVNDDLLLDSPVILSEETQDVNTNDSNNTYDVKNMEEPGNFIIYYLIINCCKYYLFLIFLYLKRFKIRKRTYLSLNWLQV